MLSLQHRILDFFEHELGSVRTVFLNRRQIISVSGKEKLEDLKIKVKI